MLTTVSVEDLRAAEQLRASIGPLVRRLRQIRGESDLSLPQSSLLARLDRDGPSTPGALAAAEQIRPQSIAATVSELERGGLVRRSGDPADGRRVVITLTAAGRTRLNGSREARSQRLAQAMAVELTASERERLVAVLPLLVRLGEVL